MNVAFTIVAKNYIGLAKMLRNSIYQHNHEIRFFIFVADEPEYNQNEEPDILFAKDKLGLSSDVWTDMSFKYSLTEFCTAIKPSCFEYLFDHSNIEKVIYFDPDIYVFSSLDNIYNELDKSSIVLVPHITEPTINDDTDRPFLQSGIYNLGFLALRKNQVTRELLYWWKTKLRDYCYDEVLDYTFTDQKWMNFIPAVFPNEEVLILRDIGLNIAPWNFYEREILFDDGVPSKVRYRTIHKSELISSIRPIVFIHYSGFDYRSLLYGENKRTRTAQYDMNYEDVNKCLSYYSSVLNSFKELILPYMSMKYTYGYYENGVAIEKLHRRLYRVLSSNVSIDNPYNVDSDSLYSKFYKNKMFDTTSYSSSLPNNSINRKLKLFNLCMGIVFHIIGYKRYVSLLRLMKHFSRYESQIFLIDTNYMSSNIGILNRRK